MQDAHDSAGERRRPAPRPGVERQLRRLVFRAAAREPSGWSRAWPAAGVCAAGALAAIVLLAIPGAPLHRDGAPLAIVAAGLAVTAALLILYDRVGSLIAELGYAALRDPLTDLLNRRGFDEVFDIELERSRRAGASLSVVSADIDRFKRVNDELGHAAGDAALRWIARIMRLAKRRFDTAARVGGEEFVLLVPDSDEHGAYMLAERIRSDVERELGDWELPVTISLGIATFPIHGGSASALTAAADQALYAAKRLGRNRSVISSAEVPGILARVPRERDEAHVELASLLSLAEALDVRDSGNASHCHRVGRYAELIGRELGLPPDGVDRLRLAGILHDVGRVGVPDSLLAKPDPLTDAEWQLMRSHPEIGARLVETTEYQDMRSWILHHHERPDGQGYPDGLASEELPLQARVLAVADAYEAMTSERPYREALDPDAAAAELRRSAGRQFDGQMVEALLRAVG